MQAKLLQHRLGVVGQFFQFVVRSLGTRELHQFHLLKLVLADDSAHILAVRSGLAAKARSVRGQRNRQARRVEHFVAIEIRHRNLGRRNQPKIFFAVRHAEQILRELRQLARAIHGL